MLGWGGVGVGVGMGGGGAVTYRQFLAARLPWMT